MKRTNTAGDGRKNGARRTPDGDVMALEAVVARLRAEVGAIPRDRCALAEAVIAHLTVTLPDAMCVVAMLTDDDEHTRVVAADVALRLAPDSVLVLDKTTVLRTALGSPNIVHSPVADCACFGQQWTAKIGAERTQMACAVLPEVDANAVLVVFFAPKLAASVDTAIEAVRGRLTVERASVTQALQEGPIGVAKRQWEQTVDALDELVLLLDRHGRVLRANRTLERWGLGTVNSIRGTDCHIALHPQCTDPSCRLARLVSARWKQIRAGISFSAFDFTDASSQRSLRIAMRSTEPGENRVVQSADSCGVVVVVDVTEQLRAQRRLNRLNDELEHRVRERTAQLETANRVLQEQIEQRMTVEQDLRQSRDEFARLSEELIHAQEKERHRTALELHDTVGQSLGAAKYTLERFMAIKNNPALGDSEAVLSALVGQLQQAITNTRSLSMSLRPSLLDDMGAVSALRWFCQSFAENHGNLDVLIEIRVLDADVPPELAVPVFRIAQEALTNVAKHAQAHTVLVALRRTAAALTLEIRDDGAGFDPKFNEWSDSPRLGIVGMRERSLASGGSFAIVAGPEAGTQIRVEWPLQAERPARAAG